MVAALSPVTISSSPLPLPLPSSPSRSAHRRESVESLVVLTDCESPSLLPSPSSLLRKSPRPTSAQLSRPRLPTYDLVAKTSAPCIQDSRPVQPLEEVGLRNAGTGRSNWDVPAELCAPGKGFTLQENVAQRVPKRSKTGQKAKGKAGKQGDLAGQRRQSSIVGAKVTKPRQKKEASQKKGEQPGKQVGGNGQESPLRLERVVPRRLDWTPVKDTKYKGVRSTPAKSTDEGLLNSLQGVLGSFQYAAEPKAGTLAKAVPAPPMKRRKLDLIDQPSRKKPALSPVKKDKGAKKKPRTITGLATEEYMRIDTAETPHSLPTSLLASTPRTEVPDSEDEGSQFDTVIETAQSALLPKSYIGGRGMRDPSRLHSPQRAIEAAAGQEVLFGTSSQLVRDESPSFTRELQHALRESEASCPRDYVEEQAMVDPAVGKKLWSAASRDHDGSLLEAEIIDLSALSDLQKPRHGSIFGGAFQASPVRLANPKHLATEPGVVGTNVCLHSPFTKLADPPGADGSGTGLPKSMAEAACRTRSLSPAKKKKKKKEGEGGRQAQRKKKTAAAVAAEKPAKDMSDYNNWTVAELAKRIKSFGFKPVKGKAAMVALLQKCPQHQQPPPPPPALQPLQEGGARNGALAHGDDDNTDAPRLAVIGDEGRHARDVGMPPRTDAHRLRKQTTEADLEASARGAAKLPHESTVATLPGGTLTGGTTAVLEEPGLEEGLLDIEENGTAAAAVAAAFADVAAATTSSSADSELLDGITRAVTSYPPTHDPRRPTWHEKMLLYDPIVLEDLTTWLNTEGLARVGVDDEVWPSIVRTWCEQRSVCCLWRENLRGGRRTRY